MTLGLCSQTDPDFQAGRAAKDRPTVAASAGGATLIPAEVSTADEAPEDDPYEAPARPGRGEKIDADSVFAKLKGVLPAEDEED